MVAGDHDRDQRVGERLVDVGGVLGVLGEPVEGGDDAVANLVGGYVVEEAAQARAVHAHPRVAGIDQLVSQMQPEVMAASAICARCRSTARVASAGSVEATPM